MGGKRRLLLHSCCGPCSTSVIERLAGEYEITLFFYNPNITDPVEYEKRKTAQLQFLQRYNEDRTEGNPVEFMEGRYDTECFYRAAAGLESEPEGGERCAKCFELRLSETAVQALNSGFDCFGTTLSVSPHKNYALICQIGSRLAGGDLAFLEADFKKKAGFQRSIQLSKEYGLYRQNYCGCEFSDPTKLSAVDD